MPKQGDLVLIPIPFTDLSSQKRRPVIVISNDDYHRTSSDVVVVAMTSNPVPASFSFVLDSTDMDVGSLNRPGTVRVDKIYTLAASLIVKTFGRVNKPTLARIQQRLLDLTKVAP
ncbi:MAG: type II toxin-antitoxin system PemK/MazF family toxin [Candidatus Saccharimonas sp.]|nr:type II toxin-antitoxin system PemK/MazF family toxin [Planctomycetaceae bacterium]